MYKVLLVDDCRADILGISENMDWQALGCEIVGFASNGQEGIEKALECKPDIIITDVSMPDMDGIVMTKTLRQKTNNLHFIFISCFDEFSYIKSAMDEDVSAYVLKPIKLPELAAAIRKITLRLAEQKNYRQLETRLQRNTTTLTERFLTDLLLNPEFDSEFATLLNIPYEEMFFPALFQLKERTASALALYQNLSSLKAVCQKNFRLGSFYIVEFGIDSLVLIVHKNAIAGTDFVGLINTLQKEAEALVKQKMLVFASCTALPLAKLHLWFRSLNFSAGELSGDEAQLPLAEANAAALPSLSLNAGDLYSRLTEALFADGNQFITELIDTCFTDEGATADLSHKKAVSVQMINTINAILNEYNGSFSDIFDDEFIVWNKLLNFNSIMNIRQWMTNMLLTVQEYLKRETVKADRYEALVKEIKSFINLHYPSPTIIEEVAETVHLSANHANSIFKKATGQTLFNYTVEKRLQHAKALMADKALSISDIAQTVGYSSSAYFATAFKKNTGMSPMQYRSRLLD